MAFLKFFKIVAIPDGGLVELCTSKENQTKACSGIMGHFINILSTFLKFDYDILTPDTPQYGAQIEAGNWTGAIGMVHRGEADIGVNIFSLTEARAKAVKFSFPLGTFDVVFITKPPGFKARYLSMLYPFEQHVWFSLVFALFLIPFFIKSVLCVKNSLKDLLFDIIGSLLRQPITDNVPMTRARFMFVAWLLFAMIISYSYSSLLLSFLTIPIRERGVRDIRDLEKAVSRDDYTCYIRRGTSTVKILKERHKDLWHHITENNWLIDSFDEVVGILSKPKIAVIIPRMFSDKIFGKDNPEIVTSDDKFEVVYGGIIFNQAFSHSAEIDKYIHRMMASGLIQKLLNDFRFQNAIHKTTQSEANEKVLSLKDLKGAFLLLFCGYSISFIFLFFEVLHSRYFSKA